ncbi:MAG TPA: hypothetical protein VFI23_13930 [Rhizomicrobium sp.]|nr:hypothetical protein [Rhizomicrobium sp.]
MGKFVQSGGRAGVLAFLLLFAGLVLNVPRAYARPQDEVMSSAYRCAVISSTRVWLDCYYGAAQPMRAALGLAPALTSQIALNRAPPAGGNESDLEARNQVLANASRCGSLMEGRQWLDCYYSAAIPVRVVLGLSPPQPQQQLQQQVVAPAPVISGSRRAPSSHHVNPIAAWLGAKDFYVESRMSSYTLDSQGLFTVTLDNGQTWRQIDSERVAHWSRTASKYLVTITGGAFGSYNLAIKGDAGIFKVRPVR